VEEQLVYQVCVPFYTTYSVCVCKVCVHIIIYEKKGLLPVGGALAFTLGIALSLIKFGLVARVVGNLCFTN
jgi:hypothetical protein